MLENGVNQYLDALLEGLLGESTAQSALLQKAYQICHYNNEKIELTGLQSILGHIGEAGINKYFLSKALVIDKSGETIFATEERQQNLEDHIETVKNEIRYLKKLFKNNERSTAFKYSLFHLLYAQASRVGYHASANNSDTSLFDRNRVLAAVTQCLIRTEGNPEFLLLKGAVSGIQRFIYDGIKAEQIGQADSSAKRLRGRSFMIALFNQILAEYIIEELGLEQANILFVGGGHFNILIPNTEQTIKALENLTKTINIQIIEQIGLQLGLIISWIPCKADLGKNFSNYYRELHLSLESEKQRRHQSYLTDLFSLNFREKFNEDELIGTQAPYAKYLLELVGEEKLIKDIAKEWGRENGLSQAIEVFSFLNRILFTIRTTNEEEISKILSGLKNFLEEKNIQRDIQIKLIALNDTSIFNLAESLEEMNLNIAYGFRFIGNYAPTKVYRRNNQRDVMLFEDLACLNEKGEEKLGYSQLGVMRLDVDDLGAIFARGLGENAPIERIICLSREFQLFFGGFFNKLAENHHLYIVYSGGDDAFVIGSWLNVIHFAEALEKAFRQFTCNNDQISFSAGIFICNPHYPIPRLAEDGGELEKEAKNYGTEQNQQIGKNAIALFKHVLPWDRFQKSMEFARKLERVVPRQGKILPGKNLRRSMLQRLLSMIQAARGENLNEFYHNAGRLHGLMARHGYTYKKLSSKKEKREVASEIVTELLQEYKNREHFEDYLISLNYILHKTRVVNQ